MTLFPARKRHSELLARLDGLSDQTTDVFTKLSDQIAAMTRAILTQGGGLAMTLDDIKAKVDAENTVIDSAVALLGGLSAKITELAGEVAAAGQDPAKLQALADEIDAKSAELAAAVTANTPAAPAAQP